MDELPDNDGEYLEYQQQYQQQQQQQPTYCWVDRRNLPWRLLDDSSLEECSNAINRPLWACNSITDEVMSVPYGPNFTSRERLTLIGQADKLSNAIGQCERIHQTAVPLNYARHALRSLTIWLFTLPFALVGNLGLLTGPICAITSWLMFGVYQIGHSIEDPFQKTLRLSLLCNAIRRDVLGGNRYRTGSAFSTATPQALPEVIVTSPMASNSVLYDDSNIADSIHITSMQ
jgi:predicted membrane chloride channel (bestrophin family)